MNFYKTISKTAAVAAVAVAFTFSSANAATNVVEGDAAKTKYEAEKSKFHTLKQINKRFVLVAPDGTENKKPKEMTVATGEFIFITNEEDKVVHNVYDQTDQSWVLKKQKPSGYAAISFDSAGTHKLRCAIHPKMKITIHVK